MKLVGLLFLAVPALGSVYLPHPNPTHSTHYTQVAIQGVIGLALIKITALVVVLATLLTGGLLIKLFSLGLVFGTAHLHHHHATPFPQYRATIEPRLDIVKTVFKIMVDDSNVCKKKLICLLENEAIQSPLLESAFHFLIDKVWKFQTDDKFNNCNEVLNGCNLQYDNIVANVI